MILCTVNFPFTFFTTEAYLETSSLPSSQLDGAEIAQERDEIAVAQVVQT